ncbi:hypothetical protein RMATCC62417_11646 [Rhizopus microsporus]|nr:hypothetical protein RMATCC62417_11646 [Rhizopus microsporus]
MEDNNEDDDKNEDYIPCNDASQHEGPDYECDRMLTDAEAVDDPLTETAAFDVSLSKVSRHWRVPYSKKPYLIRSLSNDLIASQEAHVDSFST